MEFSHLRFLAVNPYNRLNNGMDGAITLIVRNEKQYLARLKGDVNETENAVKSKDLKRILTSLRKGASDIQNGAFNVASIPGLEALASDRAPTQLRNLAHEIEMDPKKVKNIPTLLSEFDYYVRRDTNQPIIDIKEN